MAESILNNYNVEQNRVSLEQDNLPTDNMTTQESKDSRHDKYTMENKIGKLLSWGCGEFGQHGHGHLDDIHTAQASLDNFYRCCGSDVKIKSISCGGSHTVVVTESDEIYSWGNGKSGQLGCGDKEIHCEPICVILDKEATISGVGGVCCGSRHTVYWLANGHCYSCGNNFYAQLGYDFRIKNYKDNQVSPHLLHPIIHKKIVQVACGEKHTLFRIDTGQLAVCGANGFGQLGTGNREESVSPRVIEDVDDVIYVACGANHSLAVSGNGTLYVWGFGAPCGNRREDVLLPSRRFTRETNIISAAGSGSHSLALSANGTVYSWGGGSDGQLGHGEEVTYLAQPKPIARSAFLGRISQVACGDAYSAAVMSDGTLHMWGRSSHVIYPDKPPSWRVWRPHRVTVGRRRIGKLACGSWHMVAVTGIPEWQPNEEESAEEDEDDDDSSVEEDDPEDGRLIQEIQHIDEDEPSINVPISNKRELRSSRNTHATSKLNLETVAEIRTIKLPREQTKLTLEEFYAPTPLPEVAEVVAGNAAMHQRCAYDGGVIREEMREEVYEGKEFQDRAVTPLEDELYSEVSSETGKAETDLMIAQEEEDPTNPQGRLDRKERKTPWGEFVDHPREHKTVELPPTQQLRSLTQPPLLARSRTMPVTVQQRRSTHDWSAPSRKEKPIPAEQGSRFTIDKHVSLQLKRKGKTNRSSSLPTTPERLSKKIAQVSLKGVDDITVSKSRSADQLHHRDTRRVTHHPPKINKFRSLSSKFQSQKGSGDQIASLVSSIKLETPPEKKASGSSLLPSGSPKGVRHNAWGAASKDVTELRPLNSTNMKGPSKYNRKPVFSSASSWRKRPENSSESGNLFEDLKPITNSAPAIQKSFSSPSLQKRQLNNSDNQNS